MSLTYVVSNIRRYIDVAIFDSNNDWNLFKIAFGPFKSVSIRNPDKDRLFSTKKWFRRVCNKLIVSCA